MLHQNIRWEAEEEEEGEERPGANTALEGDTQSLEMAMSFRSWCVASQPPPAQPPCVS